MTNATPGAARTFNNRLVLITGAGSGLGFECAKLFASHGARLLLTGRDSAKLQTRLRTIKNRICCSGLAACRRRQRLGICRAGSSICQL